MQRETVIHGDWAHIGGRAIERGEDLTKREKEIIALMVDGLSNVEIASSLFISPETVKTHVRKIFWKLEARNRAHAVAICFRLGLLR